MQVKGIIKILGSLIALFSLCLLPPLLVSLLYRDGEHQAFLQAIGLTLAIGIGLWFPTRKYSRNLRFRDGFLIVVLIWVSLSLIATIPFLLVPQPDIRWIDALFEATSGLTTTGATILVGLDDLPKSILFYRQQLQWLGGMGIIVLAVAVMPALGVGGMQLYRAETPGPVKDSRMTPRIAETAKLIWYIYLGLTALCAIAYRLAGMDTFDAISHAFSTLAIGGFSTHDASLGHFQSPAVYLVATVFMLLAGLNFALHFTVFRQRRLSAYLRDPEARVYFGFVVCAVAVTFAMLNAHQIYDQVPERAVQSLVQVVSIVTTTGFATTDYAAWPTFVPMLLLLLSTAGGCAGSTAGGMKIIRIALLFRQGLREISRLVHPSAIIPIKLGGKAVSDNIANAVWGYLSLYIFSFVVLLIGMLATGTDVVTSLSSVIACLNNLGPGLGEVINNYQSISDSGKLVLTFAMLLGRLELFTLLVLVSPVFWKG